MNYKLKLDKASSNYRYFNELYVVFSYLGLSFTGPLKGIEEELCQPQAQPKQEEFGGKPIHAYMHLVYCMGLFCKVVLHGCTIHLHRV